MKIDGATSTSGHEARLVRRPFRSIGSVIAGGGAVGVGKTGGAAFAVPATRNVAANPRSALRMPDRRGACAFVSSGVCFVTLRERWFSNAESTQVHTGDRSFEPSERPVLSGTCCLANIAVVISARARRRVRSAKRNAIAPSRWPSSSRRPWEPPPATAGRRGTTACTHPIRPRPPTARPPHLRSDASVSGVGGRWRRRIRTALAVRGRLVGTAVLGVEHTVAHVAILLDGRRGWRRRHRR